MNLLKWNSFEKLEIIRYYSMEVRACPISFTSEYRFICFFEYLPNLHFFNLILAIKKIKINKKKRLKPPQYQAPCKQTNADCNRDKCGHQRQHNCV